MSYFGSMEMPVIPQRGPIIVRKKPKSKFFSAVKDTLKTFGGHPRMRGLGYSPYSYGLPQNYYSTLQQQQIYRQPYQQYNYGDQYSQYQPRYIPYGGTDPGVIACNQQGGLYNAFTMTCSSGATQNQGYVPGQVPNVVGLPKWSAVSLLNNSGYRVWLLNEDGYSGGVPSDYDSNRVEITVQNGVVSGQAKG